MKKKDKQTTARLNISTMDKLFKIKRDLALKTINDVIETLLELSKIRK
jgi:hypothetical protein